MLEVADVDCSCSACVGSACPRAAVADPGEGEGGGGEPRVPSQNDALAAVTLLLLQLLDQILLHPHLL